MKSIDLHIHTVATISDKEFDFSIEKLKEYVTTVGIDCIAITNHNMFDLCQYGDISSTLGICTLPGIEIDLERGHLLLISDSNELYDFSERCKKVQDLIKIKEDFINLKQFQEIFTDLSKYILIPHYDKKPIIKQDIIDRLCEHITSGEVTSVRKFKTCIKETDRLVPVIFSDMRLHEQLESFSTRQTYVDLDEVSFKGIKACLFDKGKVFLSKEDGNEIFQVTDNGLKISTGLNVLLGERSSGKTHTLNKICDSFNNVKYIKQFSLLQNDEDKFKDLLSVRQSSVSESFLKEFKEVVEDVSKVDLKQNEINLEKYLTTLLKFASENDKQDSFSKAALFSEGLFAEIGQEGLKKLIESTIQLIENTEFREIIDRHILVTNLKNLTVDLMNKYVETEALNLKKRWLNELISNIQSELRFRTNCTFPEDIDFYTTIWDIKKVETFSKIVNDLKLNREIDRKEIRGFKVVAYAKKYTGASQLKAKSRRMLSFMDAFSNYGKPYLYLNCLKSLQLEETEYYRYFVDIEYKTLNKHEYPVSGGERSEFNLLHEISDALKHDLLLIDEPESSFDNLFLKNEVNELIKDISKEIPVIVVTHNSTVGASIQPDYVVYTQKTISNGQVIYKVFSGYPSSKQLKSSNGETIENYDIMLNCLEAGNEAYTNRRIKNYEVLKN